MGINVRIYELSYGADRCFTINDRINIDDFDEGIKKEGEYFMECLLHPQREAMIHIFFGERAASKISDVPKDTKVKDIKKAGTKVIRLDKPPTYY